jgi:uncharacterized phage protein (TIGR01671 family)
MASIRSGIGECMEDKYLSKAKRISDGEWVVGYIIRYGYTRKKKYYIVPSYASDLYCFLIDKNTISRCTGLRDKNGTLIWENDIINTQCGKAIVVWDKAEWRIKWIKDTIWRKDLYFWVNERQCEVIGNIFDNPELLESEG